MKVFAIVCKNLQGTAFLLSSSYMEDCMLSKHALRMTYVSWTTHLCMSAQTNLQSAQHYCAWSWNTGMKQHACTQRYLEQEHSRSPCNIPEASALLFLLTLCPMAAPQLDKLQPVVECVSSKPAVNKSLCIMTRLL